MEVDSIDFRVLEIDELCEIANILFIEVLMNLLTRFTRSYFFVHYANVISNYLLHNMNWNVYSL